MISLKTKLTRIAKVHFNVETLETQNDDELDSHVTSVWSMRMALEDAYKLGSEDNIKGSREENLMMTDRFNKIMRQNAEKDKFIREIPGINIKDLPDELGMKDE